MAPSRGERRVKASSVSGSAQPTPKRTPRSTRKAKDVTPDVFHDMLAEAAESEPAIDSDRPLKRRRILREGKAPASGPSHSRAVVHQPETASEAEANVNPQTVEASSEDEDESDFGFEDVDLGDSAPAPVEASAEDEIADVSIAVDSESTIKPRAAAKRKPATAAEKARRLVAHQSHVLCLLSHCIYVNGWCNAVAADSAIARSLVGNSKSAFINRPGASQFEQNKIFMKALQQASDDFSLRFNVTSTGMSRACGDSERNDDTVNPEAVDKSDFLKAARTLEGSQDTGNQLFCALLRSLDVEARMVCSLQALPLSNTTIKGSTPRKITKPIIFAIASDTDPDKSEGSTDDTAVGSSKRIGKIPSVRRRLGQPSLNPAPPAGPSTPKDNKRPVRKLSHPVFWVEAFNPARQKWIAVDPVVTGTVNKVQRLEPPSSYELNHLSYVVAFEDDCVATDVTRRYAKAYNAKTRRQRVDGTGDAGMHWWKKTMRFFRRRGGRLDRDQVEDAELAQKEGREGMPANIQDFKGHPVYALERHLRRHEVIHPMREVGKVNAGTASRPRMEAVFRRRDVLTCRSADKWYRLGRVVKPGEQPLKHTTAARVQQRSPSPGNEGDAGVERRTALYAEHQTDVYVPASISASGRIPRNAFGNLDIYVPSMVPAGGVHIRSSLVPQAANILRIDHADAVTGFTFKGRKGTAVIDGGIIGERYEEAVVAVIDGLLYEQEQEKSRQRSLLALRLWKRFFTGLRIAARVAAYGDDVDEASKPADERGMIPDPTGVLLQGADIDEPLLTAGQYTVEELVADSASTKRATPKKKRKLDDSDDDDLLDTAYELHDQEEGGFLAADAVSDGRADGGVISRDEDEGGGFLMEEAVGDGTEEGGGLLAEEERDQEEDAHMRNSTVGGILVDDGPYKVEPPRNDNGGGFVVDDDPLEVKDAGSSDSKVSDAGAGDFRAAEDVEQTSFATDVGASRAETLENSPSMVNGEPEDAASDEDSLLSHDPEDDDAEPDWLESD